MKRAIVHQVGEKPVEFDFLAGALKFAANNGVTGYIALQTPERGAEVINLKNGKRPGVKKGTWVSCWNGY